MGTRRLPAGIGRRLALFAAIGALAVAYSGAKYARIIDDLAPTSYEIHVELATSGGIFPGAEVTYRGVPIGRVGNVVPDATGIRADLEIDDHWKVPANASASVHDRSAVGEQYVDLVPASTAAPDLENGDTIPIDRTSTPLPPEDLLASLDRFATSVNKTDLATTVNELGTAFEGESGDIGSILDNLTGIVAAARTHMPATVELLHDSAAVMGTQNAQAGDLQSFTRSLAQLTQTLRQHDPQLRRTLVTGVEMSRQLTALVTTIRVSLPLLLQNLVVLGGIGDRNLAAIEEMLVALPYNVDTTPIGARGGWAQFVLQATNDPTVCTQGYIPPSQRRSTQDLRILAPNYGVGCTDPKRDPRGSAHAP